MLHAAWSSVTMQIRFHFFFGASSPASAAAGLASAVATSKNVRIGRLARAGMATPRVILIQPRPHHKQFKEKTREPSPVGFCNQKSSIKNQKSSFPRHMRRGVRHHHPPVLARRHAKNADALAKILLQRHAGRSADEGQDLAVTVLNGVLPRRVLLARRDRQR